MRKDAVAQAAASFAFRGLGCRRLVVEHLLDHRQCLRQLMNFGVAKGLNRLGSLDARDQRLAVLGRDVDGLNQAWLYSRRSWWLPRRWASAQVGSSAVAVRIASACWSSVIRSAHRFACAVVSCLPGRASSSRAMSSGTAPVMAFSAHLRRSRWMTSKRFSSCSRKTLGRLVGQFRTRMDTARHDGPRTSHVSSPSPDTFPSTG